MVIGVGLVRGRLGDGESMGMRGGVQAGKNGKKIDFYTVCDREL